jgi:excisionase family DNA binding protein
MTDARPTMSVKDAAEVLGVHANTIRNYIREGLIEAFTMPGGFRRPYADSVLSLVTEMDLDWLRNLLVAKAERLERQAAVMRRMLDEMDQTTSAKGQHERPE